MQFIPVSGVAKVELVYQNAGGISENVFHVQGLTTWDATTLLAVCSVFQSWWNTNMKPLTHTGTSLIKLKATDLSQQYATGVETTFGLPIAGTATGNAMPNNVAVCVKWTTEFRGRSYRGRTFIGGLCESETDGDMLDETYAPALKSAMEALLADTAENGYDMVVVSLYHNKQPRTAGEATGITGVSIDPYVDSQRRRLTGRGR